MKYIRIAYHGIFSHYIKGLKLPAYCLFYHLSNGQALFGRKLFAPAFFKLFPYENLVLILRDGRDVVNSTIKTWPDKYAFSDICSTWDRNANMILNCNSHFNNNINSFLFIKFEEALNKSFDFIKQLILKKNHKDLSNFHPNLCEIIFS